MSKYAVDPVELRTIIDAAERRGGKIYFDLMTGHGQLVAEWPIGNLHHAMGFLGFAIGETGWTASTGPTGTTDTVQVIVTPWPMAKRTRTPEPSTPTPAPGGGA
jgi:hypothetical protein